MSSRPTSKAPVRQGAAVGQCNELQHRRTTPPLRGVGGGAAEAGIPPVAGTVRQPLITSPALGPECAATCHGPSRPGAEFIRCLSPPSSTSDADVPRQAAEGRQQPPWPEGRRKRRSLGQNVAAVVAQRESAELSHALHLGRVRPLARWGEMIPGPMPDRKRRNKETGQSVRCVSRRASTEQLLMETLMRIHGVREEIIGIPQRREALSPGWERSTPGDVAMANASRRPSQGASLAKLWGQTQQLRSDCGSGRNNDHDVPGLDTARKCPPSRPPGGRVKVSDPWGS